MNKQPNIFKDHIFFKVYKKYFPVDESFWERPVTKIIDMPKKDVKILFNEFISKIQLESSNFQKPLSKRNVLMLLYLKDLSTKLQKVNLYEFAVNNITFLYAKEDLQALKERLTPKEIERLLQNNKELIEVFL
jgi:hypothetical protein